MSCIGMRSCRVALWLAASLVVASCAEDEPVAVAPAPDRLPSLPDRQLISDEDEIIDIPVLAGVQDPDGDTLIVVQADAGEHRAEVLRSAIVRVTPRHDFHGTITVTYRVSDGKQQVGGTAIVMVQAVNDPPVAPGGTLEVRRRVAVSLVANDPDGDALSYEIVTQPQHGALRGTPPEVVYVPDNDFSGDDEMAYRVSDGQAASAPAVFHFHVTADAAPVAVSETVSGSEDQALSLRLHGSDADDVALQFTIERSPEHGTLSGTAPVLLYTPSPDFHGDDSVVFSISDGARSSNLATLAIHLAPVNDAPVAMSQTVSVVEDGSVTITLAGADVDGDLLSFTVALEPSIGALSSTSGSTLTYTPFRDQTGVDFFYFFVSDGTSTSELAQVEIHVAPANDPPTANPISLTLNEDTATAITLTGSDIDQEPLSFAIAIPPAHGTLRGTPPNLTYTPGADYNGSDAFTFTASDQVTTSMPATVSLEILPVDDRTVAMDASVTTTEDTPVTIPLRASDVDDRELRYFIRIPPIDGSVTLSGANATYTPGRNAIGTRTFTFFAAPAGKLGSNEATVTIEITPVNDPPTTADDFIATDPGTPVAFNVIANDSDPEGDAFLFDSVEAPAHGAVEVVGDHLVYTPEDGFTGLDVFGYTVVDSHGASSTGQIHAGVGMFPAGAPAETLATVVADLGDRGNAASISEDGRYVVFPSSSSLVRDDTNGVQDIYLYDRGSRTVSRVSVASDGRQANSSSLHARISANGRYIVFESRASNLAPGDSNGVSDVFRHDRVTGETVRVSVSTGDHQASGPSSDPTISDDGNVIAFTSAAFDLVANDANGAPDVFVRDMAAATTGRASVSMIDSDGDLGAQDAVISGDGLHVAFSSAATNLVPGDGNALSDVFVRDLANRATVRASVGSTGSEANGVCNSPALSRDGRFVAFASRASTLVAPPVTIPQLFVRDTQARTTTRPTSSTVQVSWGRLSGDGRYLVEQSSSGILLIDRFAGASVSLPASTSWSWPVLSGNGRYVVVLDATNGGRITVVPNPL